MIKQMKLGQSLNLDSLESKESKTLPPPRFTEVKLISTLEQKGIGRPSTFASIVSVIQDRGYVVKKKNQLIPTFLGFTVARLLGNKFPQFTDYDYTAQMEEKLDEIAAGTLSRSNFLKNFWSGKQGFDKTVDDLAQSVDFTQIREFGTIDLHNGYSVSYSKFGAYLQDNNGQRNDKGYLPSVRLADEDLLDDYLDPTVCKELFENSQNASGPRSLGALQGDGPYTGWSVIVREGKYGAYIQASHPNREKALSEGKKPAASVPKPVNQKLPEGVSMEEITMEQIEPLYAEIKLPRTIDANFFTGIGKKGAWLGYKATARSRKATFVTLPEDLDPRTLTAAQAKEVWAELEGK